MVGTRLDITLLYEIEYRKTFANPAGKSGGWRASACVDNVGLGVRQVNVASRIAQAAISPEQMDKIQNYHRNMIKRRTLFDTALALLTLSILVGI